MTQILLNGHPTWALLPKRKGKTVVLLHGGLSSSASLLRVLDAPLSKRFAVAAFDRRGHGRTADTDEPFSLDAMADETIAFLEFLERRVNLVGHSDGANVALLVALRRPDLLKRVVVVGANYHYEGLVPMKDFTPESEGFAEFARKYAKHSPDGIEHAAVVVNKFTNLVKTQPTLTVAQLTGVSVPVLVMVGDDDVARLDHTVSLYESIPEAQLAIVPGASHAVLKEHTKECVLIIEQFLRGPASPLTKYPLRRAISDSSRE
ncbi:MAG TPA: alpha/beta hydrolase [Acidimicrobiales bacterium]|nr:alpha/beta hydrolase [Acidimicrobiales bacterium]